MRIEYLSLNLLIIIGPLLLSFDQKVRFVRYWPKALSSIVLVMIPFLLWDAAVSGLHWHFNEKYTLPFRFLGLPAGEILFFISVPFACLFIWQIIVTHHKIVWINNHQCLWLFTGAGILSGLLFILWDKPYTSIVCFGLALTIGMDKLLKTHILSQKRIFLFFIILTGLILVFNGYLTARPVVLYDSRYFLNIRIWTIPIEDFAYGYALILLCTIGFEKLKGRSNA
ncbi:lycopene cyclase domain-containing protein [bacterium]|nr:lycopene cyclase domain-containing protein [bacterium]